jgi:hypothetical protein
LKPYRLKFPSKTKVMYELNARIIKSTSPDHSPVCFHCGGELNLHQPDESLPSRLLATCDGCARWFSLVEINDEDGEILMFELPGKSVVDDIVSRIAPES